MILRIIICFMIMLSSTAVAHTKRALVIGLGQQQDAAWNKINGDKDVPLVQEMLRRAGFKSVVTLVNRQATKQNIVSAFRKLAVSCRKGDVVYIHYSGHGQQMTDVHGDETDGLDECWIPYDACRRASRTYHGEKHLTDDELNVFLNAVRSRIGEGGRLLVVVDTCHSGDSTRGDADNVARGVEDTLQVDSQSVRGLYEVFLKVKSLFMGGGAVNPDARPLAERWVTLSACGSDQVNTEMRHPKVGKLTYALWMEMRKGRRCGNAELLRRIRRFVDANTAERPQRPVITGEDLDKYNITDILLK